MKRTWPIEPGSIVKSLAGRDEGRYFIVISVDGEFAMVADGGLRGIDRQKKKRLKHLKGTGETISGLRMRLEAQEPIENHQIRAWLAAYRQKEA